MKHEVAGELAMVAVPCGEAELPGVRTVRIAPDGRIESTNGTIIIDAEGAGQIVDEYRRHGVDLPIDVEHETLSDRRAPAAGWIRKLWYEPGLGLMAHVEWTIEGREHIRAGRYRYLSPVLIVNKDTHRATALHSAAIVTKPAIPRMERLAASSRQLSRETFAMAEQATEGQTVRTPELVLGEIAGVLMVESKGTVLETLEAVLDKLKTLVGDEDDDAAAIAASVRDRLGLDIRASRDEVLVALSVATANSGAMCELADMRRSESERIAPLCDCARNVVAANTTEITKNGIFSWSIGTSSARVCSRRRGQ